MALIEKRLKIGGMFCAHCQTTIQRGLRKLNGVQAVSVSYQTGGASITYDPDRISLREIEETVQTLGYEVLPDAQTDITRTVSLLGIIISLYVILQQFGVLNLLVPSQLAESGMGYGMLFFVGLLTSVHCIAMCGGINLSQSLPRNGPDIERPGRLCRRPCSTIWGGWSPTPPSAFCWVLLDCCWASAPARVFRYCCKAF